jgi:chemotaxis protein CheX
MNINDGDILQLAGTIWEAMLGIPVAPTADDRSAEAGDAASMTAACVQITGAWNGAVLLMCPAEVARRAASIMFGVASVDAVSAPEMQDAVAELANMVGGNIKALLPEGCALSLPTAVKGSAQAVGSRRVNRVAFECESHAVSISVFEKAVSGEVASAA